MPSCFHEILPPLVAMTWNGLLFWVCFEIAHKYMTKSLHVSLGWLPSPGMATLSPVCLLPLVLISDERIVSETLVWSSDAVSCCAAGRMGELLHTGGSASVKKVRCTFCQRHQGFGVSTLARLSYCTHSSFSTGRQQR